MEVAWLIELKQSVATTPTWYGETDEGVLGMTTDHMKAIRFARKWDAEMVLGDIGWTEAFVCEHAWEHFTGEPRPRVRLAPSGGHSPHATPVSAADARKYNVIR